MASLPNVSVHTLADLGFLSRGSQDTVRINLSEMRSPIDKLYRSWEELNLDHYMSQFGSSVVQTGQLKNGRAYSRDYDAIRENRRALFPRLERVHVRNYEVMFQGVEDGTATFGVVYSMDFRFRDGRLLQEHNVKECYKVRKGADGLWRIIRNDDYQQRICT